MTREEIIKRASGGSTEAHRFLTAYARRAHWLDDLIDQDKADTITGPQAERLAEEEAHWITEIATNAFFQSHRDRLLPVMLLGLNAWVDSEKCHGGQRAGLKGLWHETVYAVAMLTGGWPALRSLTSTAREYDAGERTASEKASEPVSENGLRYAPTLPLTHSPTHGPPC